MNKKHSQRDKTARKHSQLRTATEDNETIAYEATRQDNETSRQDGKKTRRDDAARRGSETVHGVLIASVPQRVAVSSDSRADVPEQGNDQRQQGKTRLVRSRTRSRGGTVDEVSTNTMVGSEDEGHTEAS